MKDFTTFAGSQTQHDFKFISTNVWAHDLDEYCENDLTVFFIKYSKKKIKKQAERSIGGIITFFVMLEEVYKNIPTYLYTQSYHFYF